MSNSTLVTKVLRKNETGELQTPVTIGVDFDNVIDTRSNKGGYSLAQFFDAYVDYMNGTDFIYYGANQPQNTHTALWIDTSVTNQL